MRKTSLAASCSSSFVPEFSIARVATRRRTKSGNCARIIARALSGESPLFSSLFSLSLRGAVTRITSSNISFMPLSRSSGTSTTKTGTTRSFAVSGDRFAGDDFQDALLDHALKYGTGQSVIKKYVYFNMLTGKGEQGSISIAVEDDNSGEAGSNASWSATLTARGTPQEDTYSPAAMASLAKAAAQKSS